MLKKYNISELITFLDVLLHDGGIRRVLYIDPEPRIAIPQNGNFSSSSRLAVPFEGCHRMDIPDGAGVRQIHPERHNATFMPKGSWNAPDWELPVKVVTFHFFQDFLGYSFVNCPGKGLLERYTLRGQVGWTNPDGRMILELAHRIFADASHDVRGISLIETLVGYCLEAMRNNIEPQHGKAHATFMKICAYLEDCYASGLSRDAVAETFQISPNYLSNLFKSQSGISFSDHINQLRIKRACHLLSRFNQPLDEVAMNCGFNETGYFCRVFKKQKACTPGEYRRKHFNIQ